MLCIRGAKAADLDAVDTVLAHGRAFLHSQGLPQWQNGYGPGRDDVRRDIERGEGYVLAEGETVYGYAAMLKGVDDCYTAIKEGAWDGTHPDYISIHRVAFSDAARGRGLSCSFMKGLIAEAARMGYKDIRVDTYEGNAVMRRVIERAGFAYAGKVEYSIPNGERLAFQMVL